MSEIDSHLMNHEVVCTTAPAGGYTRSVKHLEIRPNRIG